MNLSPAWVENLKRRDWVVEHWMDLGSASADDATILSWARSRRAIILTQDMDFVQLLHQTRADGPSLVLLRVAREHDAGLRNQVRRILIAYRSSLEKGAILVIDQNRERLRELPLPIARRRKR